MKIKVEGYASIFALKSPKTLTAAHTPTFFGPALLIASFPFYCADTFCRSPGTPSRERSSNGPWPRWLRLDNPAQTESIPSCEEESQ